MAFKIGALTIHWYGVLVALGFLIGLWTASRRGLREGIAPEKIMDIGPWLIVGTIIGARTLHVISYWDEEFAGRPWTEVFMVQKGGLVYYGGFIGATLAGIIYLLWKKLPLWKFADVLAPSIPLGYVLGRIGCLMNGCCYGRTCDLPWAIRFPKEHSGTQGMPVHPTQLYDALLSAGLWLFLAWLFRRKRFDGQVFAAYLLGYAVLRSIVEFFRGDYSRHYLGWATPAHLVSIGIFSIGLILLWLLPKGTARPIRPAQSSTP